MKGGKTGYKFTKLTFDDPLLFKSSSSPNLPILVSDYALLSRSDDMSFLLNIQYINNAVDYTPKTCNIQIFFQQFYCYNPAHTAIVYHLNYCNTLLNDLPDFLSLSSIFFQWHSKRSLKILYQIISIFFLKPFNGLLLFSH